MKYILLLLLIIGQLLGCSQSRPRTSDKKSGAKKVLLFVSYEDTYYSEFIVMKSALEAGGYIVDVASVKADSVSIYMIPDGTTINATANTLSGSSYSAFQAQYVESFGNSWDASLNTTPNFASVDVSILDVADMDAYEALVIVGGIGAQKYLVDGDYQSQGAGGRMISATEVETVANKLNSLAVNALQHGKAVMGQCHGSGLPVYWRIPSTSGPGAESIGYSLLKNGQATGYPEPETPVNLTALNIVHRLNDKVTVSNPHSSLNAGGKGVGKIITTKDWYPQTVAHAARTLMNIIETYPSEDALAKNNSLLIIHGGSIDASDCGAGNKQNDVPCNYGGGANLPADYNQLVTLFNEDSQNDDFLFTVSDLNLSGTLPYANTVEDIASYLEQFEAIIFFKHWSTNINDSLQSALVRYVDNGGGVLALHHGLYNDIHAGQSKDILVNQLFGAHSAQSGWSGDLENFQMFNTNYGHFVNTYGIAYQDEAVLAPNDWLSEPLLTGANRSLSYYQTFPIYDEVYRNMAFVGTPDFGRNVNQITPILSNNAAPTTQMHVAGFVKIVDIDLNGTEGKVACFEPGERKESLSSTHIYGQIIRNTMKWLSTKAIIDTCESKSYVSTVTACDSYTFEGVEYFTSGTYSDTLSTSQGCDSILVLHLTLNTSVNTSISVEACNTYEFNGKVLTSTGEYVDSLLTVNGCDSIITLNLTISTLDVIVSQSGDSLIANIVGGDYQWLNCANNQIITGAMNKIFVPDLSGDYAVIVDDGLCADTSECYAIKLTGVKSVDDLLHITLFPNPADNQISIQGRLTGISLISITNALGQIVMKETFEDSKISFSIQNLPEGMYTVVCTNNNRYMALPLLIKR